MDSWIIEENEYDASLNKHYEGVFAQGNGFLSIRGNFEEPLSGAPQNESYLRIPTNVTSEKIRSPKSKWGTYIPGVVGQHPLLNEEVVNLPFILGIIIVVDGEKFNLDYSNYKNYKRYLNMKNGVLTREVTWLTNKNKEITLKFVRYVDMVQKHIISQNVSILSSDSAEIEVHGLIDGNVTTNGYCHFQDMKVKECEDGYSEILVETDTNESVKITSKMEVNGRVVSDFITEEKSIFTFYKKKIHSGEKILVKKITALSRDVDENLYQEITEYAKNFDIHYKNHNKAWESLWLKSDVTIVGDEESQLAIRFSIYHLLRVGDLTSNEVAICAKGTAGEAYFGRFFWDTEIYLIPFYLNTNPKIARKLLEFRHKTLEGAKRNAQHYGYRGAKYAWESSISGIEQCPNWQFADLEVHVTADIIYAMENYLNKIKDEDFYGNIYIPILMETSKYWLDRISFDQDGNCHLNGVMGPDEYTLFAKDNAYTNQMVKYVLQKAKVAFKRIPSLKNIYNISDEDVERIDLASIALPIPKNSANLVLQSADWDSFEDIKIDEVWKNRKETFASNISQEKNYRSKALKQADVVELMYLFPHMFSSEEKQQALDYYTPITTHDSSLSYIVYSMVNAQVGNVEEAYSLFLKATMIDLDTEDGHGAAEGIHIANCGGLWQAIVYGFCGIDNWIENNQSILKCKPRLPQKWELVSFNFSEGNNWYKYEVTHDGIKKEIIDEV